MTILETFIKLRDDLKTWVTNNLNQKANISYVDEKFAAVPEFDPTELQAAIDTKVDKVEGKDLSTNDYTSAEKDKLATVDDYANFYEHPVHTSYSSGLYKVEVDGSGHVSGATLVEKEDIVALGIPAQDTTYDTEISDLSDKIDGVSQEFESYKTTNNEAVAANASGVVANKQSIEEILGKVDGIDTHLGIVDDDLDGYKTEVGEQFTAFETTINTHTSNTENPHGVTKEQVGLANVDNTADIEKPISNAMQSALNKKADREHQHYASDITDGILGVAYGGTGYDSIVDTEYTTARYRASTLDSTEIIPVDNGIINWVYE